MNHLPHSAFSHPLMDKGDLLEANENVVVDEDDNSENIIELVWREHLPLGMNLLTNDRSGLLKVVEFPVAARRAQSASAGILIQNHLKALWFWLLMVRNMNWHQNYLTHFAIPDDQKQ